MNANMTWPIVLPDDNGIRPAGPPDECFYCHRRVGEEHTRECVSVVKKVQVVFIAKLDVDVPHCFSDHDIEFKYNEGSWCGNNLFDLMSKGLGEDHCLCGRVKAKVVKILDETPRRSED